MPIGSTSTRCDRRFRRGTAAIALGSTDDSLVQQVPAACVPPAFSDPPIVRPIDRATTGCDLDGEPSATDPADQARTA